MPEYYCPDKMSIVRAPSGDQKCPHCLNLLEGHAEAQTALTAFHKALQTIENIAIAEWHEYAGAGDANDPKVARILERISNKAQVALFAVEVVPELPPTLADFDLDNLSGGKV